MISNKVGRNDPCLCGSGKKYKHCCMPQSSRHGAVHPARPAEPQISDALAVAATHLKAGRINEAADICQKILQYAPAHAPTLCLFGILAYQTGRLEVSINLLRKAINAKPNYAEAYNNLGVAYKDAGKFNEATSCFQKALSINPNYGDAIINLGNAMQDIGLHKRSASLYRRAIQIKPDHVGALSNLANVLQELNSHDEAIKTFQALLKIDPDYDYALGSKFYSKLHCCDWSSYEADVKIIQDGIESGKNICKPFDFLALADSPNLQFKCAATFIQHNYPRRIQYPANLVRYKHEKIRVAYLSADFRQHAVSQLLVEVVERHDRNRFEIIGISFGVDDQSELRHKIISAFDQFFDVRQHSDKQVATLLSELEVDIAVDLMGFTTNSRTGIFSYKPAPIQAGFLGYAGTTGTDYMDYIIADQTVIPEENRDFYSEKVFYLPGCFQPNDSSRAIPETVPTRIECRLPEKGFVFCAFNNHYKITPQIFEIWMRLLLCIEGSVIWLASCNDPAKQNLQNEARKRGVNPCRLVFAERMERLEDHLARHQLADLFLDTLPYNAHTTASDALWAGLPVLTCQGASYAARVASSLLRATELSELITCNLADYEKLALALAKDSNRLSRITQTLRKNRLKLQLFDTEGYLSGLEDAYIQMCHAFNKD